MRLLVEVSGQIDNWHRALVASKDAPRLPLPFSCTAAFIAAGHKVSAISFRDETFSDAAQGSFVKLYGQRELTQALAENDIAFLWAGSGIKAIAANRRSSPLQKVLLGSYVWRVPRQVALKVHGLVQATRLTARYARGLALMTAEQTNQALDRLGGRVPVVKFTWGIDSAFYQVRGSEAEVSSEIRQELKDLLRGPFVILAGDQQRLDKDAIELVERFNVRLVRVPQEHATATWYKRQITERHLHGRLFVFDHVTYRTLRFLLQRASAYVGLVDSTWQPAGWTVLCEAFASGTPAIVYEGLTPREMRSLGAGDFLATAPHRDVAAVARACELFVAERDRSADLSARAQGFSKKVLDLQHTAPAFVKEVEGIFAGWPAVNVKALLAHPGTQHSFQLARELDRKLVLQSFYTGLAWRSGGLFDRLMLIASPRVSKRLANRKVKRLLHAKLHRRSRIEVSALWKLNRGMDEQEVMHRRNELFQRSISSEALRRSDVVIGVDTASWILVERCRELGKPFVLDQSIGHPDAKQAVYDSMRSRFSQWNDSFEIRRPEVREAEIEEQASATMIVAASSFTKQTLVQNGVPPEKICVIPYGVDCSRFVPITNAAPRPFRFVFLGTLTARKGIPLLLQAWRQFGLSGVELWLVGPVTPQVRALIPKLPGLQLLRAVPQIEVPALLRQCDVFVFPSYFEGFGLVVLEAMACGLPVITTTATAGPDIMTEGHDGFIIEPGNLDSLVSKMNFCLNNRHRVTEMGNNARATAQRFSWDAYGDRWAKILQDMAGKI
jgi:starch synthase